MYFRGSVWGLLLFPTFKLKVPNKICIQYVLDFTQQSCPTGPHPHLRMSPETGAHLSRTRCPLSYHLSHQLHLLSPQNSPEFETPRLEGWVEYIYTQTVQSQYFSHQALDKHQEATKFTVWPWASDLIISGPPFPHLKKGTNNTYFSELWELNEMFSKTLNS